MLFPNAEEAAVLTGTDDPETQGARLAAHYPLVVVKRGAAGCEACERERRWRVAAPPAEVARQHRRRRRFRRRFLVARLAGKPIEALSRRRRRRRGRGDGVHRRPAGGFVATAVRVCVLQAIGLVFR